jgi:transcriptional regulator with XRE-family HTH domain
VVKLPPEIGPQTIPGRFGRNVARRRRRLGISKEELAERAQMERDSIRKIEAGQRSVRLLTLLKLAEALDVDPCELLAGLHS